jgi:hypothetical protein
MQRLNSLFVTAEIGAPFIFHIKTVITAENTILYVAMTSEGTSSISLTNIAPLDMLRVPMISTNIRRGRETFSPIRQNPPLNAA